MPFHILAGEKTFIMRFCTSSVLFFSPHVMVFVVLCFCFVFFSNFLLFLFSRFFFFFFSFSYRVATLLLLIIDGQGARGLPDQGGRRVLGMPHLGLRAVPDHAPTSGGQLLGGKCQYCLRHRH